MLVQSLLVTSLLTKVIDQSYFTSKVTFDYEIIMVQYLLKQHRMLKTWGLSQYKDAVLPV